MPEPTYRDFLKHLEEEFNDFIKTAQKGRTVRSQALKARKKSLKLREDLKFYRNISLYNDEQITKIIKEFKKQIEEMDD